MSEPATCNLCGNPMPSGEEMFNYHGYSGPCPTDKEPIMRAPTTEPSTVADPRDHDRSDSGGLTWCERCSSWRHNTDCGREDCIKVTPQSSYDRCADCGHYRKSHAMGGECAVDAGSTEAVLRICGCPAFLDRPARGAADAAIGSASGSTGASELKPLTSENYAVVLQRAGTVQPQEHAKATSVGAASQIDLSATEEAAFKAGIGADYDYRKQEWLFNDFEGWAPEDVTNALAAYRQSKAGSVK